jgi:hypothetical protein
LLKSWFLNQKIDAFLKHQNVGLKDAFKALNCVKKEEFLMHQIVV